MKGPTLAYIATFTYLIPPMAAVSRLGSLDRAMRVFFLYSLVSFLVVLTEYILGAKGINNAFISNYSDFIECVSFSIVYSISTEERRIKVVIRVLALLFICAWVVNKMYFETPGQINGQIAVVSRTFIIVISVLIIQTLLKNTNTLITNQPMFWVSAGSILYSAGVLVIFGLSNEIIKHSMAYFQIAWHINWSLIIVTNLMFTKGFLCRVKK